MLAAVPSEADKRLELFRLALLLSSRGSSTLPPRLGEYFDLLLRQAQSLVRNPDEISAAQLPQAMQLASELMSNRELSAALSEVRSAEDLSPAVALKALSTLEPVLAPAD